MTQDELWLTKWQDAIDFLETNHRKPSKFIHSEKVSGLSADTWEGAIDEAKSRFPGEPDYDDIDEDWARESYYRSRASEDNTYSEMFTSLLGQ